MKKYLLDTNIYLDACDRYYRNEYFSTFWEKFAVILNEHVILPKVVKDEITKNDWFHEWLNENFQDDILNHRAYVDQWQMILDYVQSCGLYKDSALANQTRGWANDTIADPWLTAIAKEDELVVVTNENREPKLGKGSTMKAAKVPDICDRQGVRCIGRNEFFGEIGLSV